DYESDVIDEPEVIDQPQETEVAEVVQDEEDAEEEAETSTDVVGNPQESQEATPESAELIEAQNANLWLCIGGFVGCFMGDPAEISAWELLRGGVEVETSGFAPNSLVDVSFGARRAELSETFARPGRETFEREVQPSLRRRVNSFRCR